MRHKRYPFYVVLKDSGLIIAGNEYREDANDTRLDLGIAPDRLQVLTATGVMRKYGQIKWTTVGNPGRTKKLPDYMVGLPTVTVEQATADMNQRFGPAPQPGYLAALDPATGRVVMYAGKAAHHIIRMNAAGGFYTLARIV